MKSGWEKYANKKRYIKKGYLRKYLDRDKIRQTPKTGSCDCIQQSREEPKEEIVVKVVELIIEDKKTSVSSKRRRNEKVQ